MFNSVTSWDFLLVSVHLKALAQGDKQRTASRTVEEVSALICVAGAALQLSNGHQRPLLMLGDFNWSPGHTAFDELRANGLEPLLSETMMTNSAGTRSMDNIWASAAARALIQESE